MICIVPKPLTLYTNQWGTGKKNKVVKLNDKEEHIIPANIIGESTKRIAEYMKLSTSSVKRVWMHWTKTKISFQESFIKSGRHLDAVPLEGWHELGICFCGECRCKKGTTGRVDRSLW